MTEPRLFDCERLKARISPRQCLTNRIRAATLKEFYHGLGPLWNCINCEVGRRVEAILPGER
jgi:hypothetical protein